MDALGELFSKLVPTIATLLIIGIPGLVAVPATILHVTFWRRDNRANGGNPYTFSQIVNKTYLWGSIFGIGSAVLLQGLVELLLEQTFSWQLRVSLAIVGLLATGRVSRVGYDMIRGYSAHKSADSKGWKRVYDYFTVTHPPKGEDTGTLLVGRQPDDDPTITIQKGQDGFGYIEIIIGLVIVAAVGTAVTTVIRTYNGAIRDKEAAVTLAAETQGKLDSALNNLAIKEGELKAQKIVHEADITRLQSSHDLQILNQQRKQDAIVKASIEKIEATMNRDAEKYTEFIRKVLPQNLKGLACRSNLRTVDDPDACYITIR